MFAPLVGAHMRVVRGDGLFVLVRDPNGAREPGSTLLVSATQACRAK